MEKKRIEWIDSLKGALMIGVIWSHSSANTGGVLADCLLYGSILFLDIFLEIKIKNYLYFLKKKQRDCCFRILYMEWL